MNLPLFIFDKETLLFNKINSVKILFYFFLFLTVSFMAGNLLSKTTTSFINSEIILSESERDKFSEEKLKNMIYSLHLKFPEIVIAQAYLETGNFKSKIFYENNNLFGMKLATQRPCTTDKTLNNHAQYDTWQESVYDYALYQSRYLYSVKTESEYYAYLHNVYAEDSTYISKLKMIVDKIN